MIITTKRMDALGAKLGLPACMYVCPSVRYDSYPTEENKCSDWSMEVNFSLLREIMTDRSTERQTGRPGLREVSFPT